MCRSQAQGGQRCYSHAWKEYQRASAASAAATRRAGGLGLNLDPAIEHRVHTALVSLASTPKGADWVRHRQATSRFPTVEQPYYESVLRQGDLIAERNKALGNIAKHPANRIMGAVEALSRRVEPGWLPPEEEQIRAQIREEADDQVVRETLARMPADHPERKFVGTRMQHFRDGTIHVPGSDD
jgi:hypothetical protein